MDIYEEADLYCAAFDWPSFLEEEVDWLLERYPEARSVLEPFCGQARYARAFAARGITYVGFDLAESMLARAPCGEKITVVSADARSFSIEVNPPGGFDLAWCPINSLSHMTTDQEAAAHLQCVRRHLNENGAYVVELSLTDHDGEWKDPPGVEHAWTTPMPDGSNVQATWLRLRCNRKNRTCTERATSQLFTMRMWTCDSIARVAQSAGFDVADQVVVHEKSTPWPTVPLSDELHNTGSNYYFFLTLR
jgi:hypothetical protein